MESDQVEVALVGLAKIKYDSQFFLKEVAKAILSEVLYKKQLARREAMTTQEKLIKNKLGLIELAD